MKPKVGDMIIALYNGWDIKQGKRYKITRINYDRLCFEYINDEGYENTRYMSEFELEQPSKVYTKFLKGVIS